MRHDVTFGLDDEIKNSLNEWGIRHGWKLEETIRYILGDKVAKDFAPYLTPISSLSAVRPVKNPFEKQNKANDDSVGQLIRAMVSTGMTKCRNCLKQLSSEEVLAGECSSCGEKI